MLLNKAFGQNDSVNGDKVVIGWIRDLFGEKIYLELLKRNQNDRKENSKDPDLEFLMKRGGSRKSKRKKEYKKIIEETIDILNDLPKSEDIQGRKLRKKKQNMQKSLFKVARKSISISIDQKQNRALWSLQDKLQQFMSEKEELDSLSEITGAKLNKSLSTNMVDSKYLKNPSSILRRKRIKSYR